MCEDGAVVTFDWGQDLPARVEAASGMSTAVIRLESRAHGVIGEFHEVFVSHRGLGNPMADLQRRDDAITMESDRLRALLAISEKTLSDVLTSRSWRITRPFRTLGRAIRR